MGTWEGFAEKEGLSLEWKSEGVMDDENGESMEPMEKSATHRIRWVRNGEIGVWSASISLINMTRGNFAYQLPTNDWEITIITS